MFAKWVKDTATVGWKINTNAVNVNFRIESLHCVGLSNAQMKMWKNMTSPEEIESEKPRRICDWFPD